MTPMNPAFRKLLLRNIPKLTNRDLDRYDSALALRLQVIQHLQLEKLPNVKQAGEGDDETKEEKEKSESQTPLTELPRSFGESAKDDSTAQAQQRLIRKWVEAIKAASDEAQGVIQPFRARFEALHELWIARRRVQQGYLLQIPTTFPKLVRFIALLFNLEWVSLKYLWKVYLGPFWGSRRESSGTASRNDPSSSKGSDQKS